MFAAHLPTCETATFLELAQPGDAIPLDRVLTHVDKRKGLIVTSGHRMEFFHGDCGISPDLDDGLAQLGVKWTGVLYRIMSIIGPQSASKSTLLICLLATTFPTMDPALGRPQTAHAIHISRADACPIVTIDLEGSDSREQGDEDARFGLKSDLFAMALSEVVIVSSMVTGIADSQEGSVPLLDTAFRVQLELVRTGRRR